MNKQIQQIRDFAQNLLDATRHKDGDYFAGQHIGLYAVLFFIDSLPESVQVSGEIVKDMHGQLHAKSSQIDSDIFKFGDLVEVSITKE